MKLDLVVLDLFTALLLIGILVELEGVYNLLLFELDYQFWSSAFNKLGDTGFKLNDPY